MVDSRPLISQNVRYLRTSLGLTQENLAFASGMTTACISRLERSPANPTVGTLDHIANGLKVRTAHLFDEELASREGEAKTALFRCFDEAARLPVEQQEELTVLIRNFLDMCKVL